MNFDCRCTHLWPYSGPAHHTSVRSVHTLYFGPGRCPLSIVPCINFGTSVLSYERGPDVCQAVGQVSIGRQPRWHDIWLLHTGLVGVLVSFSRRVWLIAVVCLPSPAEDSPPSILWLSIYAQQICTNLARSTSTCCHQHFQDISSWSVEYRIFINLGYIRN